MQKNFFFSLMLLMSGAVSASGYYEQGDRDIKMTTGSYSGYESGRTSSVEALSGSEADDEGDEGQMSALALIEQKLTQREEIMTDLEQRVQALEARMKSNKTNALNN